MKLNLEHLALLGLLTAPAHYLIARAEITRFAWSRAPGPIDRLLRCAACSGAWLGLGAGMLGIQPIDGIPKIVGILAAGLVAMLLTPIVEGALLWGIVNSSLTPDAEDSAINSVPIAEAVPRSTLLAMADDLQLKALVTQNDEDDVLLRAQADALLVAAHLGPHDCGAEGCPAARAAVEITRCPSRGDSRNQPCLLPAGHKGKHRGDGDSWWFDDVSPPRP